MIFVIIILMWNAFANEYPTPKWKGKCSYSVTVRREKDVLLAKYLCDMYIVAYKLNFWSCRMKCWRIDGLLT